jgi:hypothetical protein
LPTWLNKGEINKIKKVGAAKFVSKFDLLKGYWQVPLMSMASEISAFITHSGLYSFSVMSFGLHNAPATFLATYEQGCLRSGRVHCLSGGCSDICIYLRGRYLHLSRIQALFDRLDRYIPWKGGWAG